MVPSETVRKYGGSFLVAGIGVGLLLTHIAHILSEEENTRTFLLGIILPMTFAGGVLIGGLQIWRRGMKNEYVLRVAAWCALGAVLFSLDGVLTILYQREYGVVMDEQLFVVSNGASAGAFVGFTLGIYDIRRRREQTRADRLAQQLTVLNRVLRHDIRNSANVIQGNAELLTRETVDTAAKADIIRQQATDLITLGDKAKHIEQLLSEQGERYERVDIASLVRTCCDRIRRDHPSAKIDISLPPTLYVRTHQLIDSALMNVIQNAVEHNDKQRPYVTIESIIVSEDGTDYVELRISDNGPGIGDNEIDVLERGYETNLEHASGLGLWLVYWIITNADGDVRFEENESGGSIVCLRLKPVEEKIPSSSVSNTADAVE